MKINKKIKRQTCPNPIQNAKSRNIYDKSFLKNTDQ